MDVGLMVEGQHGLDWNRWRHILALGERLEFPTVFRSDHFFLRPDRQQESLDPYLSFTLAAVETSRLRFGPLVTPITFRHPVHLARMASQLSLLSSDRFVLGLGAGWNAEEHLAYGLCFPSIWDRFARLEEAISVIRALWKEGPATFDGRFYRLSGADCLPKAVVPPPILIGGAGEHTLGLVAQFADEWNTLAMSTESYKKKCEVLDRHCARLGRDPASVRRSMVTFGLVGPTEASIERVRNVAIHQGLVRVGRGPTSFVGGTTEEVVDTLGRLAELGLNEIEFQHFELDTEEVPEYIAAEIAPRVRDLH